LLHFEQFCITAYSKMSSDQSGVAADQPGAAPTPAADENTNEGVRAVGSGGGTDDAVVAGAANNGINRRGTTGESTPAAPAASGTSERLTEATDGNARDQGAPAVRGPVHAGEPAAMRNLPNRSEVTGEGHPYVPDLNAPNSRFLVNLLHKFFTSRTDFHELQLEDRRERRRLDTSFARILS
jgi:hypothetical protein